MTPTLLAVLLLTVAALSGLSDALRLTLDMLLLGVIATAIAHAIGFVLERAGLFRGGRHRKGRVYLALERALDRSRARRYAATVAPAAPRTARPRCLPH